MYNLHFISREQLNETIWRYTFQASTPVQFIAGQYTRFRFPFEIADPNGKQHRTFTLISQPNDTSVSFMTRITDPHSVFKQHLTELQPGDAMSIDEPRGAVVLPEDPDVPLVFACAGIGIASTISILTSVMNSGTTRHISLLYGLRSLDDAVYNSLFEAFPFVSKQIIISPQQITPEAIFACANGDARTQFCISGPPGYIESVQTGLLALGAPEANIRFDAYKNYGY
ncbi:MAG: ferredoxin--NADP reductase [Candidatus Saccharimonadales bacterium]